MNKIEKISPRFLRYHNVISDRLLYIRSNANHAGRFYSNHYNIYSEFLEKTWYEPECIDHIMKNFVVRDLEDILEDHLKNHNLEWLKISDNDYMCNNFKIKVDHMNYVVTEQTVLSKSITLEDTYHTESIEDAFQFVLVASKIEEY